jgi:hypothetical protein
LVEHYAPRRLNSQIDFLKHFAAIPRIWFQEPRGRGRHHKVLGIVGIDRKYVELYNRDIVYGDKRTLQVFTRISPSGMDETHTAFAIPCLADIRPKWNRNKPNAWLNGSAPSSKTPRSGDELSKAATLRTDAMILQMSDEKFVELRLVLHLKLIKRWKL